MTRPTSGGGSQLPNGEDAGRDGRPESPGAGWQRAHRRRAPVAAGLPLLDGPIRPCATGGSDEEHRIGPAVGDRLVVMALPRSVEVMPGDEEVIPRAGYETLALVGPDGGGRRVPPETRDTSHRATRDPSRDTSHRATRDPTGDDWTSHACRVAP